MDSSTDRAESTRAGTLCLFGCRRRSLASVLLGLALCSVGGMGPGALDVSAGERPTAAVYLFGAPDSLLKPHVAADGSVVGGTLAETPVDTSAFLISVADLALASGHTPGPFDTLLMDPLAIEEIAGNPGGRVRGISGDGERVLFLDNGSGWIRIAGIAQPFPSPPAGTTLAALTDLAEDGRIAVGTLTDSGGIRRPFRADVDTGIFEVLVPQLEVAPGTFIPVAPTVHAVSGDGSTLVGLGPGFGASEAYTFDESQATILDAGFSGTNIVGSAEAVNGDGTIVLGYIFPALMGVGTRWTDGVLDPIPGFGPIAISSDGLRMAGTWFSDAGYWSEATGPVRLGDVLESVYGFDLGDYRLQDIAAMSNDGRVLVGRSGGGAYPFEGFVAVLDPPIEVALPEPRGLTSLMTGIIGLLLLGAIDSRRPDRRPTF